MLTVVKVHDPTSVILEEDGKQFSGGAVADCMKNHPQLVSELQLALVAAWDEANTFRDVRIEEVRTEVAEVQAKLATVEAERDALGTKSEAEAIRKQQKIAEAIAKKQAAEAELAELTKVEIAIDAEEEVNVKA